MIICVDGVVTNCDFTRTRVESGRVYRLIRENLPSEKISEKTFRQSGEKVENEIAPRRNYKISTN